MNTHGRIKVTLTGPLFDARLHLEGDDQLIADYADQIIRVAQDNPSLLTRLTHTEYMELACDEEGQLVIMREGAFRAEAPSHPVADEDPDESLDWHAEAAIRRAAAEAHALQMGLPL